MLMVILTLIKTLRYVVCVFLLFQMDFANCLHFSVSVLNEHVSIYL